jgi:hypothetical protein
VNNVIRASGVKDDEVSDKLAFRNIHYFAAGASMFGTDVKGAYQFNDKEYNGRFEHARGADTCAGCHNVHELTLKADKCTKCHENVEKTEDARLVRALPEDKDPLDYDGDGNMEEGVAAEISALHDALLAAIQQYTSKTANQAIAYNPLSYPYWFTDTNKDGKADGDEVKTENAFKGWTPNMLRAAYNYQFVAKDPGSFVHNPDYILQVLYDSIEAVGGKEAVAKFNRPPVRAAK